jgi:hypothetical protein
MSGRFRPLLHPFFFALFPVLSLLSANINEMAPIAGLRAAVLTSAAAGGALLMVGLLTNQWHRAAIVVSLLLLFLLSFGHFYKLLLDLFNTGNTGAAYGLAVLVWLLLLGLLLWLAWTRLQEPAQWTQNLNIAALVMLLLPLYQLTAIYAAAKSSPPPLPDSLLIAQTTSYRPDIYYIILDGYARADVLSAVYQLDNAPFIQGLEARGFFVAGQSRSNYVATIASLASSLNFHYLDQLAQEMGPEADNLRPLRSQVQQNQVQLFLDGLGYETITIASGYPNTEARQADLYLTSSFRGLNHFETLLLQHTPAGRFLVLPGFILPDGLQYAPHRERILFAFDSLTNAIPARDGPKFVFAHILAPHPPFVFGPDGEFTQPDAAYTLSDGSHFPGTREEYIAGYRDQLLYVNQRILETVDQILSQSSSTPILIIQSDHGAGAFFDWSSAENNTCLQERTANFMAILTPDSRAQFSDSLTPVNLFPILFNSYFDTRLALLENKTYFAPPDRPYDFTEITSQIGASDACLSSPFTGQ